MAFSLPQRKDSAGGVLEYGHPAYIHYVKIWSMYGAAGLSGLSDRLIGILHGYIQHPVWRHALRALLLAHGISGSGVAAGEFEHRIKIVGPHGTIFHGPAEERRVESFSCILVRSGQLNPAKRTCGMLIDICHSSKSIRPRACEACAATI